MNSNRQIVLAAHPEGPIAEQHFALRESRLPRAGEGQFVLRNLILSMDAGFRQWMNAGAGDDYLPGMQLGDPVQAIVIGRVIESRNPEWPVGRVAMARTAWEEYSLLDGSELCSPLEPDPRLDLREYVAALGTAGLTAFFGLQHHAQPGPGKVLVVSAAAGAVGTMAGQIGRLRGCRSIGLTSRADKARWLVDEIGYDAAIARELEPDLGTALAREAPGGVDIFFDNVGGAVLDALLPCMREQGRIVLCGSLAQYEASGPPPVYNTWHMITRRLTASGFMFSDHVAEFPGALTALAGWLASGVLKSPCQEYSGIASAPRAFCDMMHGRSRGKCLVRL